MRSWLILVCVFCPGCTEPPIVDIIELHRRDRDALAPQSLTYGYLYEGSRNGFHYLHAARGPLDSTEVRVSAQEFQIDDPFPRTTDRSRWRDVVLGTNADGKPTFFPCEDLSASISRLTKVQDITDEAYIAPTTQPTFAP